jgi:hypothetical protein
MMTIAVKRYLSSLANRARLSLVCGIFAGGIIGCDQLEIDTNLESDTHEEMMVVLEEGLG